MNRRYKQIFLLMLVVFFAWVVSAVMFELPEPGLTSTTVADSLRLVDKALPQAAVEQKTAYTRLKKRYLAEGEGEAASASQVSGSWKLVGVLHEGEESLALVRVDGKMQRLSVGAELPEDTLIGAIDNHGITVVKDGEQQHHRLYHYEIEESSEVGH